MQGFQFKVGAVCGQSERRGNTFDSTDNTTQHSQYFKVLFRCQIMSNIVLKIGDQYSIRDLMQRLIDFGYDVNDGFEFPGQIKHIGENIMIYPSNSLLPIKVGFFGNTIESIKYFDLLTGVTQDHISEVELLSNFVYANETYFHPGDYIVHEDHGIGVFSHLELKEVAGEVIQYIVINYLNNDILRLPYEQKEKLSQYIGVGKRKPRLNKLGTNTWQKTYHKTYENIFAMARELLQVFATREIATKVPRVINNEWDESIAKTFGFAETEDQRTAIADVFSDLQKPVPMDRLICGDVGFGKTEVAIRAIAQTVANSYQVVLLAPTTILAEQHYLTLKKRFANLPVSVGRLSRFVSPLEESETIDGLRSGKLDVLVSTHKVLRSSMEFKNPGLLIIDEEQKFGVRDKEKIKKLKTDLDVLTLTATPIPRTLFMSLSGLRDISRLSSVPLGRKAVETEVKLYDDVIISKYIKRELDRGGQVYYLHNRVSSIGGAVRKLQKLFSNHVVTAAHGQMGEESLMSVMSKFTAGEIDILVCSTIIENGLDLPNANTLIVEESDFFGLSQLYQIRGRIGRSKKQSYALFTYKKKQLVENAVKRLKAIVESAELGSGYSLALRDLEIRGGGNILGRDQHGNMETVGLVLYSKLLQAAVTKLKNGQNKLL